MKRRTFIAAAVAVALIPIGEYTWKYFESDPLLEAKELNRFCNSKQISEIGEEYMNLVPSENIRQKLTDLLLTTNQGVKFKGSGKAAIADFLDKKILEDFEKFKVVVLKGWVISVTEARQCALFSIKFNKN